MPKLDLTGVLKDAAGISYNFSGTLDQVAVTPPKPDDPKPNPQPDPVVSSIPLLWDDARFKNNATAKSTTIAKGGALSNKTITDTGSTASIVTGNGATIQNCRVKSREGIRIGGGGNFLIDGCYIEVNGTGQDHADGIQTYAPGSKGVLKIRNTTIKCGINQATAGLFVADEWSGTVDLENVVIWGGPYGARIHADGGDISVRFKNVFVVGPFAYDGLWVDSRTLNGSRNKIDLWENVCEATIVNGKLVPSKLIARP
jgi:hypothetical protein